MFYWHTNYSCLTGLRLTFDPQPGDSDKKNFNGEEGQTEGRGSSWGPPVHVRPRLSSYIIYCINHIKQKTQSVKELCGHMSCCFKTLMSWFLQTHRRVCEQSPHMTQTQPEPKGVVTVHGAQRPSEEHALEKSQRSESVFMEKLQRSTHQLFTESTLHNTELMVHVDWWIEAITSLFSWTNIEIFPKFHNSCHVNWPMSGDETLECSGRLCQQSTKHLYWVASPFIVSVSITSTDLGWKSHVWQ